MFSFRAKLNTFSENSDFEFTFNQNFSTIRKSVLDIFFFDMSKLDSTFTSLSIQRVDCVQTSYTDVQ